MWPSHREEVVSLPRVDPRDGRRSVIEDHSLQRSRSQDALTAKGLSTPEFQVLAIISNFLSFYCYFFYRRNWRKSLKGYDHVLR